jgi:hypothetical protein
MCMQVVYCGDVRFAGQPQLHTILGWATVFWQWDMVAATSLTSSAVLTLSVSGTLFACSSSSCLWTVALSTLKGLSVT